MISLYTDFVRERHRIWEMRTLDPRMPNTTDPVLRTRKFTNVFRILDPGSQFVLTDLAEDGDEEDILARIFLYRHTNLPSAWRAYKEEVGRYPRVEELYSLHDFWLEKKIPVFNGAYNIYPQSSEKRTNKITSVVQLASALFYVGDLGYELSSLRSVGGKFSALQIVPGVGDFMAMQIATDIGYVFPQDENEFIVPGPGAVKGAKLINPDKKPVDTIRELTEAWRIMGDVCITLDDGTVRYPSLMDVQNTLCEFQKYHRYLQRPFNMNPYKPAHPGPQPLPIYPQHWEKK